MSPKSVLVADDDADVLTALVLRCEQLGLDVKVASDAMSALLMFLAKRPDVLIIDVNMPRGSGINVCELLAADARNRDKTLIVLTGRSDGETIARCRRAGVHYVFKRGDIWDRIKPLVRNSLGVAIED
jgi:CheY-like chemotaxis protein